MSKLEYYARPLVAFDPANKDHRRWYYMFQEHKSWGHCPVRFICPNDVGYDLTIIIRDQLIQYYVKKEFDKEKGKMVTQKVRKRLTSKSKDNTI